MILRTLDDDYINASNNYNPDIMIPATYEKGQKDPLWICHNGISNRFFHQFEPDEDHADTLRYTFVVNTGNIHWYNNLIISPYGFRLFCDMGEPISRPFFIGMSGFGEVSIDSINIDDEFIKSDAFIEQGGTFWEIFKVYSKKVTNKDGTSKKREFQYSCLRQCRSGTSFCKCDECGAHFIITQKQKDFYTERGLKIPTVRCPSCIQTKKMRYAAKNNG